MGGHSIPLRGIERGTRKKNVVRRFPIRAPIQKNVNIRANDINILFNNLTTK
jgi:hypothetical protein